MKKLHIFYFIITVNILMLFFIVLNINWPFITKTFKKQLFANILDSNFFYKDKELEEIFEPPNPNNSLYKLNPDYKNLKVETWLKDPIEQASYGPAILYRDLNTNQMHFITVFSVWSKDIPNQIIDVNLETREVKMIEIGAGRPGSMFMHPFNNKIYFFTSGPPLFGVYNPNEGTAKILYRLDDTVGFGMTLDPIDYSIWIGTCVKGKVYNYDPSKDPEDNGNPEALKDYGIIDDPGKNYYRYIWDVFSDGRYLYIAIRDQNATPSPFYLVIKDINTKEERKFLHDNPNTIRVDTSYDYTKGYATARHIVLENGKEVYYYYKLDGFNLIPLTPDTPTGPNPPTTWPSNYVFNTIEGSGYDYRTGYTVDLPSLIVDSFTQGTATIRWKHKSQTDWQEVTISGIRMKPAQITALIPIPPDKLFTPESGNYGPAAIFDVNNKTFDLPGYTGLSIYKAFYSKVNKKYYFVGYPGAWMEWDPNKPWEPKKAITTYVDPSKNPKRMPVPPSTNEYLLAKYYLDITEDRNGFLYVSGAHERDSIGSSLIWFNPNLEYSGSIYWPGPPYTTENYGVLRKNFENDSIRGLTNALWGTKILINSTELNVLDIFTKQIEKKIDLPWGKGPIIEIEPGIILGASTGDNIIYKLDLKSGKVLAQKKFPSNMPLFGGPIGYYGKWLMRFEWGPDNYIWFYIGNSIYRLNPKSEDLEPEKIIDVGFPGYLTFLGPDLYIVNRGTSIYVVKNLFIPKTEEELRTSFDYLIYTDNQDIKLENKDSIKIKIFGKILIASSSVFDKLPIISFSIEGLPPTIKATFSPDTCELYCITELSLSNLTSLPSGTYNFHIVLKSPLNNSKKILPFTLQIINEQKEAKPRIGGRGGGGGTIGYITRTSGSLSKATLTISNTTTSKSQEREKEKTINLLITYLSDLISKLKTQSKITPKEKPSYIPVEINKTTTRKCNINIFKRELKLNMKGEDVRCLQIILNADPETRIAISGTNSPGKESGHFDILTLEAVKKFQKKYSSEVLKPAGFKKPTGIVGKFTLKKLNKLLLQYLKQQ